MSLKNGNISFENPENGARAHVEKGYLFGSIDKAAMSPDDISTELAGVKIPKGGQVRRVEMANTIRDRHNEILPQSVLQKFANDISKETFSLNTFHNREMVVGLVLPKASVVPTGTGYMLKGYAFIYDNAALPTPTTDGKGLSLIQAIDDGSIKDVSIEFRGYTKYIAPENGNSRGVWEYEIDPNNPEDTEFTGLAIVPKGAQRNASIVKSIDGGHPKAVQKSKNMTERIVGGGHKLTIEMKDDRLHGIEAIEKALDDLATAKTTAEADKVKAEAERDTIKADAEAVRNALETDCTSFGKLIGDEPKAEDMAKLSLKGLFDLRESILKKHDAPAKVDATKKADDNQLKGFFTK